MPGQRLSALPGDPCSAFGRFLANSRRVARLSQRELADRLGMGPQYVSQLETGRRRPSVEVLAKLANILGLPVDEILARFPAKPLPRDG